MPSSQSEQLAKEKSGGSSLALALPLERRVRSQRSGLASKRLFSFFSLPTYLVFPQRPYCTQVVPVSLLREVGLSRCFLFIVVCARLCFLFDFGCLWDCILRVSLVSRVCVACCSARFINSGRALSCCLLLVFLCFFASLLAVLLLSSHDSCYSSRCYGYVGRPFGVAS